MITKAAKFLSAVVCQLKKLNLIALAVLCLLLCAAAELFVVNHHYFTFDEEQYQRQEFSLPFLSNLSRNGVILNAENSQLTLSSIEKPVKSVYLEVYGAERQTVHGTVSLTDDGSRYMANAAADFLLVPTDQDYAAHLSFINAKGSVHQIVLSFDKQDLTAGLVVTKLVLNEPPHLNFSFLRVLCAAMLLLLTVCFFKYQWYQVELDFGRKSHRIINWSLFGGSLLIAFVFFEILSPVRTTNMLFDINGIGTVPISNQQKSLLMDWPDNLQELSNSDAYVQLLDAFIKGQVNLDVYVDPKFAQLTNVYDPSERAHSGLEYYWDRPYYDGKYYVYFGLAPLLMTYAPIYLLTGKAATLTLSTFLLAVFAIAGAFTACRMLYAAFRPRANAVLFFAGEFALVNGAMIYYLQTQISHYCQPYMSAAGWIFFLIASICAAALPISARKRTAVMAAMGVCVVMIVLSRPLSLLFAIAITAPLLLQLWGRFKTEAKQRLKYLAAMAAPVTAGAAFVMWYNYTRFDSIFEFGQYYQLTVMDIGYNTYFDLDSLRNALYHYFVEDLQFIKNFPFIEFNSHIYRDFGNYMWQPARFGFFSIPLTLFLGFAFLLFRKGSADVNAQGLISLNTERAMIAGVLLLLPVVAYMEYVIAGLGPNYVTELLLSSAPMAFLLMLQFVKFDRSNCAVLVYAAAMFLLLKTIFIGLFSAVLTGGSDYIPGLNPEAYLALYNFFNILDF